MPTHTIKKIPKSNSGSNSYRPKYSFDEKRVGRRFRKIDFSKGVEMGEKIWYNIIESKKFGKAFVIYVG